MAFASKEDFLECRALHKRFGTTYFLASRVFRQPIRRYTDAVYGFVRVVDEWVDNPSGMSNDAVREKIHDFRQQLEEGVQGKCPESPVLRAFVDVIAETNLPLKEPRLFLDAMEMDLDVSRYPTFDALADYMRGAAAAVSLMMCCVTGTVMTDEIDHRAQALAFAMQLTNFLRDIPEDADRGRIYLPLEDLDRFQVTESEILEGQFSDRLKFLIEFEIARARDLYQFGEEGIPLLGDRNTRKAVTLARVLYSQILDHLEEQECNPFLGRARTTKGEKLAAVCQYWLLGKTLAQKNQS